MGLDPDALRLRTALRDLVALSTVPVAWVGRDPPAIASDLADLLVNSLFLDFAFVRLCDPNGGAAVEIARDDRGNGPRLMIRDTQSGRAVFLDPLELAALACAHVPASVGVAASRADTRGSERGSIRRGRAVLFRIVKRRSSPAGRRTNVVRTPNAPEQTDRTRSAHGRPTWTFESAARSSDMTCGGRGA